MRLFRAKKNITSLSYSKYEVRLGQLFLVENEEDLFTSEFCRNIADEYDELEMVAKKIDNEYR